MPLMPGEPAPWFKAPTPSNPEFVFDTAAGRYVLLVFLPKDDAAAAARRCRRWPPTSGLFDDEQASRLRGGARPGDRGQRPATCAACAGSSTSTARSAGSTAPWARTAPKPPIWLLLDPALRVHGPRAAGQRRDDVRRAARPAPARPSTPASPLHAPVLIAPRIFEPELCERADRPAPGRRRRASPASCATQGERTVAVMDELKKRRDVLVEDAALQATLRDRLERRLFPMIARGLRLRRSRTSSAMWSAATTPPTARCSTPHRDSTTLGTAHRKFACSINLNDGFEGGDLRFAEFGPKTYRPPLGGAVVFSCAPAARGDPGHRRAALRLPAVLLRRGGRRGAGRLSRRASARPPEPAA